MVPIMKALTPNFVFDLVCGLKPKVSLQLPLMFEMKWCLSDEIMKHQERWVK